MEVFNREEMPIALQSDSTEVRAREAGDMAVLFYRCKKGADLGRFMHGLPGDACTCPHWGYVLAGKLRIHTRDGDHDVSRGQAFYVEPGHTPEALEDTEIFEVSPLLAIREVADHVVREMTGAAPSPRP